MPATFEKVNEDAVFDGSNKTASLVPDLSVTPLAMTSVPPEAKIDA